MLNLHDMLGSLAYPCFDAFDMLLALFIGALLGVGLGFMLSRQEARPPTRPKGRAHCHHIVSKGDPR
jgi:hypothetical protein